MTELRWEMVNNVTTGKCRCELVEIETALVLFRGPWRKSREAAFHAARKILIRMFAEAGLIAE